MSGPAAGSWVERLWPRTAGECRLFCLPYAGASATVFRSWKHGLPSRISVCPIELPGRGMRHREPLYHRLLPLAGALAADLVPHLDLPFAFYGHSMGALLGFEVARMIQQRYGLGPTHVFVSGQRAPHLRRLGTPSHLLPDADLVGRLRNMQGSPASILDDQEFMRLRLPILRADFAIPETYAFATGPVLSCPLVAYGGAADPEASRTDLDAWRGYTTNTFAVRIFPGNHFFLTTEQPALLGAIAGEIDRPHVPAA